MPTYQVERVLPGGDLESLAELRRATQEACYRFADAGKHVRYLGSTYTPGESRCRCLFEAASGDLVREVNDAAQFPYIRIVLAVELPPAQCLGGSP